MGYDNYPPGVTDADPYFNDEVTYRDEADEILDQKIEVVPDLMRSARSVLNRAGTISVLFEKEIMDAADTLQNLVEELEDIRR